MSNLQPTETARVIGAGGLKATNRGWLLDIRLPWYRSLPLSTVELSELRIDGVAIDLGQVQFELDGQSIPARSLGEQWSRVWYVLDSALLRFPAPPGAGDTAEVNVTLTLYPPYIRGLERMTREQRRLRVQRPGAGPGEPKVPGPRPGSTLYAYTNEFLSRRYGFEDLLREVSNRGIGPGLEIVGYQSIRGFPEVSDAFADSFKSRVTELGLVPTSLGINADQEIRRGQLLDEDELVAYHEPQLHAAAKLGFPVARYQYGAGPAVIRRLVPLAERLGVRLGLEIHAPHHANHPDVLKFREMYAQVRSPFLGWIPDFSSTARTVPPSLLDSFRARGVPDRLIDLAMEAWHGSGDAMARMGQYKESARKAGFDEIQLNELSLVFPMFGKQDPRSWLELMPEVVHVHGKFFGFDAAGEEEAIDYGALLPLFRDGGYTGFISSEWEGHMYSNADAFEMVERHQAMCRRILGARSASS
ncbi:MAG: DUF6379 domain-containing protein [Steroidobacteraceae bacterium]